MLSALPAAQREAFLAGEAVAPLMADHGPLPLKTSERIGASESGLRTANDGDVHAMRAGAGSTIRCASKLAADRAQNGRRFLVIAERRAFFYDFYLDSSFKIIFKAEFLRRALTPKFWCDFNRWAGNGAALGLVSNRSAPACVSARSTWKTSMGICSLRRARAYPSGRELYFARRIWSKTVVF
jgi:hypothetical protein